VGDRTSEVDPALQQRGNLLVEIALGGRNAPLHCGAEARIEMIEALPDDLLDPLEMPFPLLDWGTVENPLPAERLIVVREGEAL
jgi:hypothetical protein